MSCGGGCLVGGAFEAWRAACRSSRAPPAQNFEQAALSARKLPRMRGVVSSQASASLRIEAGPAHDLRRKGELAVGLRPGMALALRCLDASHSAASDTGAI